MARSPLVLAALATVAVPDMDAVDVRRASHTAPGIDAAVVIDAEGTRWVVRAPQDATAGATLEAEVALLGGLASHAKSGALPFAVPVPEGSVTLPEGGRVIVSRQLGGRPVRLADLGPGPGLAAAVGRAVAALHELPTSLVEDTGLPVYTADQYRERRLSEVDEAAGTGYVPAVLLRRWEGALEDVAMWRFQPTVVHGDLSAEHVLCDADAPVGVLGWSEAKVADPADDLAWLLVAAPQEAIDPILEAYHLRRSELRDPYLSDRALLAGELAVARWLLHGVHVGDAAIIDDAREMLAELAGQIAADDAEAAAIVEAERVAEEQAAREAAERAEEQAAWEAAEQVAAEQAALEAAEQAGEQAAWEAAEHADAPAETVSAVWAADTASVTADEADEAATAADRRAAPPEPADDARSADGATAPTDLDGPTDVDDSPHAEDDPTIATPGSPTA